MSDTPENRCALARRNAGLSVAQAARRLGVEPEVIDLMEAALVDDIYEEPLTFAGRMAELYGVNLKWMLGQVDRYDYAALAEVPNADRLPSRDRDVIAEILASRPRGPRQT